MIGYKAAFKGIIEENVDLTLLQDGETVRSDKKEIESFRFYKTKEELVEHYWMPGKRFYSMTLLGEVINNEQGKLVCNKFKNITEIPSEEILEIIKQNYKELFKSDNPLVRKSVVHAGFMIDEALHDEAACVRAEVAHKRKYLDILENDDSPVVLYAVVKQNHNLKKFLDNPSYDVRIAAQERYEALKSLEGKEV